MKKDTYYFQHYVNARRDPKVLGLMADYGTAGYGNFFILLEMLREQGGRIELNKQSIRAIQFEMLFDNYDMAEKFIDELVNEYQLIIREENIIYNNRLLESVTHLDDIKEKRRSAINKRWGKDTNVIQENDDSDTNVLHKNNKSNTKAEVCITEERKPKEIKGKETKVKKSIDNKLVTKYAPKTDFIDELLTIFQEEYYISRGSDYVITNKGQQRKGITSLLSVYKAKHPDKTTDEAREDLRNWFKVCVNVSDNWLYNNMSPYLTFSKMNEIKGFTNGNNRNRTSDKQIDEAIRSVFAYAEANQ